LFDCKYPLGPHSGIAIPTIRVGSKPQMSMQLLSYIITGSFAAFPEIDAAEAAGLPESLSCFKLSRPINSSAQSGARAQYWD